MRVITGGRKVAQRVGVRATARLRPLPNTLVIGAMKAGTTSLASYLAQHPQVGSAWTKEVHYFDGGVRPEHDAYRRGSAWYRAQFPLGSRDLACVFEASPAYLFSPVVPRRIHELIPDVKLIAVLRDPVERALSHVHHEQRLGREPLDPDAAIAAEPERLREPLAEEDYRSATVLQHSYLARGRYAEQLDRYFDVFPRRQILIISSDDLRQQPRPTMEGIFDFVGVDPGFEIPDVAARNVSEERTTVSESTRSAMRDHFAPHNARLVEITGRDFGWS